LVTIRIGALKSSGNSVWDRDKLAAAFQQKRRHGRRKRLNRLLCMGLSRGH